MNVTPQFTPTARQPVNAALTVGLVAVNRITRLDRLKDMRRRWAAELPLFSVDPERAVHLREALDDLAILIRRIEQHDPSA